jgi:hypothetical protein
MQRFVSRLAANILGWLELTTYFRAFRFSKEGAAIVFGKLNAAHPGGLSLRHSRD